MSRRLAAYVHVRDEGGNDRMFGPDDEVPAWAAEKIDNPGAWAEPEMAEPDLGPEGELKPPAGNASEEKWRAYAIRRGVPEAEAKDLSKDQLKERVAALPPAGPAA